MICYKSFSIYWATLIGVLGDLVKNSFNSISFFDLGGSFLLDLGNERHVRALEIYFLQK